MNLFFKFKNKTKFRFLQKSKIYSLNKNKNFTSEMCEITKLGKKSTTNINFKTKQLKPKYFEYLFYILSALK